MVDCCEHFLVGIKDNIDRDKDDHLVHSNIDTDVIVSDGDPGIETLDFPVELFHILERLCLGMKRCHLVFEGQTT